ncbi:hypothetical protein ACIQ1J_07575 [Streptomyces sp. NPDC097107]|uniref:hypothetical protein n=1 Tax=Streptomyces sp. NPDC097107 TaxID=3366089 RepID=UPI003805E089
MPVLQLDQAEAAGGNDRRLESLRPELTAELRARGGGRLFLLSPKAFLEVAAPVLRLSLQAGSVEDIERVERIEAGATYGGWTAEALDSLFRGLAYEGYANRVDVIRQATETDGHVEAARSTRSAATTTAAL